jgi:hydrogenase expression/formation protein HypC
MCLGIPGQVVEITDRERNLARASVAGVLREISLACIVSDEHPLDACIGDWVLIHVGFAMSRINEAEAEATLKVLAELGEIDEELAAMQASDRATQKGVVENV